MRPLRRTSARFCGAISALRRREGARGGASARVAVLACLALAFPLAAGAAAADRIDTVAGSGNGGFGGDGTPATGALLTSPSDVAPLAGGGYLIADTSNHRVRRVDAVGLIATVAGAGPCCGASSGFAGEGVPATEPAVRLAQPRGLSPTADGGFLIADTLNNRVRRVAPNGIITTVAGGTSAGSAGDGGPATAAQLNGPQGVAALPGGGFLIADSGNHRIRMVDANGVITRVAGQASAITGAFGGDGGPAVNALLSSPARVAALPGGGFLIADTGNNRIRRVDTSGTITTVAGSSAPAGFGGDGGPATAAALNQPEGVAARPDGSIVIADSVNERVREVGVDGVIRTLAGTGTLGLSGDGGPPAAARLSHPRAVAVGGTRLWIADSFNHRVRAIAPEPAPTVPPPVQPPPAQPPRTLPPGVAPPVVGRSAVVRPARGRVLIRLPGTRRFVHLSGIANVPLGAELDARRGAVALQFETTAAGRRASAVVSLGRFVVRQPAQLDRDQRPGSIVLSGPLQGCRAPTRRGASRPRGVARGRADAGAGPHASRPHASAAAKRKGKRGRRARVHAEGRIEVRGRYGAAIVRGTRWTTVDRCPSDPRPGTLFAVAEGKVLVTAFALRRARLVRAGQRYLAPARRAR